MLALVQRSSLTETFVTALSLAFLFKAYKSMQAKEEQYFLKGTVKCVW